MSYTINETKEKIAVMQAYIEGASIETCDLLSIDQTWLRVHAPAWNWGRYVYRIVEEPDSIDWDQILPEFKYMVRDGKGNVFLFATSTPPQVSEQYETWFYTVTPEAHRNKVYRADHLASYKRGTKDWKDSLVVRPE